MKLTNKQIKKIIKEEINNLMKETMIGPSDFYLEILEDPNVHPKLKYFIKTGLEDKNYEMVKQGLELLGVLHPEYKEVLGMDPKVFTPEYKSAFDAAAEEGRRHGKEEELKQIIRDIAASYKITDLEIKGYYKRAFNRGQKFFAFVRSADQQGLQQIVNDLKSAGYNPLDIRFEPKTKMYRFDILFLEHS